MVRTRSPAASSDSAARNPRRSSVSGALPRARGRDRGEAAGRAADVLAANDVSARNLQYGDGQWTRGKGLDTFCPIGPRLVPAADLDPANLGVVQRLNGEVMQEGRTSDLIVDVPTLVAYASSVFTLSPGDVTLTGTPPGVGWARKPPVSLQAGDVVEVEVEGIGVLRNPVVAER